MLTKEKDKFISIIMTLLGLILFLITFTIISNILPANYRWITYLLNVLSGVILSLGIKRFVETQYSKPNSGYDKFGINRIYMGRDSFKREIDYSDIFSKSDELTLIGIKHNDVTDRFKSLLKIIENRDKRDFLNIYFLNPTSEHRFLFEEKLYIPNKLDLANEIKTNITRIFHEIENNPKVSGKINIFIYNCVPLGNVISMDGKRFLFNHYQYFQRSVDSLWFDLNDRGYGEMLIKYMEHVKKENPIKIEKASSLLNLGNEEYINVLDIYGNPTGIIKTRDEIHMEGDWHRTVHVWIINKKQEVLIQKRAERRELDPDKWDLSCAGHVVAGNNSVESAIIEVKEELGIDVSQKLEFLTTIKKDLIVNSYIDKEFNDIYIVEGDYKIQDLKIDLVEVAEVNYMHYSKLNTLIEKKDPSFVDHEKEYTLLAELLNSKFGIQKDT